MDELIYPLWQTPLQELILEFDAEARLEKTKNLEALLQTRLQELSCENDGFDERQAIADASYLLRRLEELTPSYPDWKHAPTQILAPHTNPRRSFPAK